MLRDVMKNRDDELVVFFLRSPGPKDWRIYKKRDSEEPPIDAETHSALLQIFPKIPEIEVGLLDLFERNDASLTTRPKMNISTVSLPALELRFQDTHYPHITYVGFIEGKENLNNFFRGLIKKYNEEHISGGS